MSAGVKREQLPAMTELNEDGETWRAYYDSNNPLTTATNIINGDEEEARLIYENYKEGPTMGSPGLGGPLEIKLTNADQEALEGAGPTEGSTFLLGGAEVMKREVLPEDLTRKCISPVERGVLCDKRRPQLLIASLAGVPSGTATLQSDSPPALIPTHTIKDEVQVQVIKDEFGADRAARTANHTIIIQAPLDSADKMSAGGYLGNFQTSPQSYDQVNYIAQSPQPYANSTSPAIRGSTAVYPTGETSYYREYVYQVSEPQYTLRQEYTTPATEVASFDRYARPAPSYKTILTVDSSPDSGISSDTLSTREIALSLPTQQEPGFYGDISQSATIITSDLRSVAVSASSPNVQRASPINPATPSAASRSWHEFSRHTSESDKIQIPKIHSDDDKISIDKVENPYGFKVFLEAPISTSPRREDDRITYINKGQFYPITMEYIPDPDRPIKPGTVKSVIMLVFREEKSQEDELKAWMFWHSRQHTVKQRILEVDTKNSLGLMGGIDEISHNAAVVYWNPLESSAKINIAIQCLSTDFSTQKGVKGLPLHIQIDTYEDLRDTRVTHRAYSQIKVFCDKGAERKTRDEEKRVQKRRAAPNSRKKYEDLYHAPCDRTEFYSMANLDKEPVLFRPPKEDMDKVSYMDVPFYNHDLENGKDITGDTSGLSNGGFQSQGMEEIVPHAHKRSRLWPPLSERVMLYVKREGEGDFIALHVIPPSTRGLLSAVEEKYDIPKSSIKNFYRKSRRGMRVRLDDEMLRHYCNEDSFLIDIQRRDADSFDITLIELAVHGTDQ